MKEKLIIDEECVQRVAEAVTGRELTNEECKDIFVAICEDYLMLVHDKVREVINFNEMLERNKSTEKSFPQYRVFHRNKNAYQLVFEQMGVFGNEEDALLFVRHDLITEFDEWRIVLVGKDGAEKEVCEINC